MCRAGNTSKSTVMADQGWGWGAQELSSVGSRGNGDGTNGTDIVQGNREHLVTDFIQRERTQAISRRISGSLGGLVS